MPKHKKKATRSVRRSDSREQYLAETEITSCIKQLPEAEPKSSETRPGLGRSASSASRIRAPKIRKAPDKRLVAHVPGLIFMASFPLCPPQRGPSRAPRRTDVDSFLHGAFFEEDVELARVRRLAQLAQRLGFDLADAFTGDGK